MSVSIKPMTIEHYSQALNLWRTTTGVGVNDRDDAQSIADFLARNPGASQAAISEDLVLGTVLAGTDGRRGYLHHLAVAEAARGQGIGHRLVGAALQVLASWGIRRSHIMVFKDNEIGQQWWENQGWNRRDDLVLMTSAD